MISRGFLVRLKGVTVVLVGRLTAQSCGPFEFAVTLAVEPHPASSSSSSKRYFARFANAVRVPVMLASLELKYWAL